MMTHKRLPTIIRQSLANKYNLNTGIHVSVNFTHAMLLANDDDLNGAR